MPRQRSFIAGLFVSAKTRWREKMDRKCFNDRIGGK